MDTMHAELAKPIQHPGFTANKGTTIGSIQMMALIFVSMCIFVLISGKAGGYGCGPSCNCSILTSNQVFMDCSERGVTLSDVCEYASKKHRILYLDNSRNQNIKKLSKTDLRGCERLKMLNLSGCDIAQIEYETFTESRELMWLDMSLNRNLGFKSLSNISYGLQFTQIQSLNITSIHHTFGLTTVLKRDHVCFLRNTSLEELVIDSNRIQFFETNVPILLPPNLKILHIKDNDITIAYYMLQLGCLTNLEQISLDKRKSDHGFSEALTDTVLETRCPNESSSQMKCPFNTEQYLRNISGEIKLCHFSNTSKITFWDITNASIPPKLSKISFSFSNFDPTSTHIHLEFINSSLSYVDASGNKYHSWHPTLQSSLPSLEYLNLSDNGCYETGNDYFNSTENLKFLYLQRNFLGNQLSRDTEGLLFKPLKFLSHLDLSANQIQSLPKKIFLHLTSLEVLLLGHNGISEWTMDISTLNKLKIIDLKFNSLRSLPDVLTSHITRLYNKNPNFTIDMTGNPITVTCANHQFLKWMVKYKNLFVGFQNYNYTDENGRKLTETEFNTEVVQLDKNCRSYTLIIVLATTGIVFFLSVVISGIIYRNRWKLRYFMYMNKQRLFRYHAIEETPDTDFRYDAFISYAEQNRGFVREHVTGNVENRGLSLCIHDRDFIAGRFVHENILGAIQHSRKTVVILSKAFLESKWCRYEFQMARMEGIYARDGRNCVIIVLLEHVPMKKMPLELADMVKHNCYIEYTEDVNGQELFWNNLNEAIRD